MSGLAITETRTAHGHVIKMRKIFKGLYKIKYVDFFLLHPNQDSEVINVKLHFRNHMLHMLSNVSFPQELI